MFRNNRNTVLIIFLALVFVFIATSCKKLKPGSLRANYHFNRANSLFGDGRYRQAIEEYETALSHNPELVEAHRFLGESYKSLFKPGVDSPENMEKSDKALEALKMAYEIEPRNKEIIYSLGNMYDMMRNFEEAEKYYLQIMNMEPTNMENYYVVAGFYKSYIGEREELRAKAEQMYYRRIELDPENPQGYAYLAQYLNEIAPIPEFDKAYDIFEIQLGLQPDDALLHYAMGVNRFFKAYRLQNTLSLNERKRLADQSEEALKKSIDLDSSYSFSYAYMNMLYRNVFARVYPERQSRYINEANMWQERFLDIREREVERQKLEQELKRGEVR